MVSVSIFVIRKRHLVIVQRHSVTGRAIRESGKAEPLVEEEQLAFTVELLDILFHQFIDTYRLAGADTVDHPGISLVKTGGESRIVSTRTLRYHLVEITGGRIRVRRANCPDQVCVRQGWISDSSVPVVCLPHQVVIQITGGEGDVDAAAG